MAKNYARLTVGASNTPRIQQCGGYTYIRYGYQEMTAGFSKYMERRSIGKPSLEDLKNEIDRYCQSVGIASDWSEEAYGY